MDQDITVFTRHLCGYYEKEPLELSDYEATLLAGVPNAPSVYSPKVNLNLAERRQDVVLNEMVAYTNLINVSQLITPKSFMLASFSLCSFASLIFVSARELVRSFLAVSREFSAAFSVSHSAASLISVLKTDRIMQNIWLQSNQ